MPMRNLAGPLGQPTGYPDSVYRVARQGGVAVAAFLAFGLTISGCRTKSELQEDAPPPSSPRNPAIAGAKVAAQPPGQDDGQWLMPARNYASTRYSELAQIDARNVGNLKVAWTFSTGNTRGHEAAPLIVGGTMYVVARLPHYLSELHPATSG